MVFKSFYPRIIFILATMSLVLFAILALVNTVIFRNDFVKLLAKLEKPRIDRLFIELDSNFPDAAPEQVKAWLESLDVEFNLEIFDRSGRWLTGVYSSLSNMVVGEQSRQLHDAAEFAGFNWIYYNPNQQSSFHAIKLKLRFIDTPVLNRVFFNFFISGLLVIAVSTVVGWRLVSYLNRRLDRLKMGVSKISRGEFDIHLEDDGKDEIAFLAKSFNHMSARIQKLVANLEESNAARQRLFAHASHEIKSPLTSIKGFIDIIEFMNILSVEQGQHLLPVVKKDLNRVIKITNDMLQLTQIRNPQYRLVYNKIDVTAFLAEEHCYFSQKAGAAKANASYAGKVEGPVKLLTDTERLSQVLDNLWNNALKYGDLSRPIRTELFLENGIVAIKISNHLSGTITIPPERLFEPFYRNPAAADKASGSGLGLAIVKELTEKLGGRISAQVTRDMIEITLFFPVEQE